MKKCTAALLGGVAALMTLPAAYAAPAGPVSPVATPPLSYAELLEPVPNALTALKTADAAAARAPARLLRVGWYHHHHHHHHHGYGFGPSFALGLLGGLATAPYYAPPPPPPVYYEDGPDDDDAYCERRYRSYDPRTGTYVGYDGYRHPCP